MPRNFKIVKIDQEYCDYLRNFDNKVMYNKGTKELRPFIGILFKVENFEYYAPLSSPKPKHKKMKDNIDFIKINNGNLGVVNFNNMIPVTSNNYEEIDLNKKANSIAELKRQNLLKYQLVWLNQNKYKVNAKALRLYKNYKNNLLGYKVKIRCCNFILLEEKCLEFNTSVIYKSK